MREPHVLEPTRTVRIPKRWVFFDSEAEVETEITDEEIARALEGEAVIKEHRPYLVCADFVKIDGSGGRQDDPRDYFAPIVKGKAWSGGRDDFLKVFWEDVDRFVPLSGKVYVIAHNAKYDVQVTGGVTHLVKLGYTAVSYSDSNPFFLEMQKIVTHSPRTGLPYGQAVEECPTLPEGMTEWPEHRKPYRLPSGLWFVPEPKYKTIMLISSTNYYQQSLESLGKVFGLPKLEFDHNDDFTQEKALTYARRDVDILKAAMLAFVDFVEREGLGSLSITIAGQAFSAYRHRFMPDGTIHIHSDPRALKVERAAYAGGRTECFYMGEVDRRVYYVDVNSMYPYVMRDRLYPVELVTFWESASVEQVAEKIMDDYLVVAECKIITEIPVFHVKRKRLIFPVGEYWTALTTPEIIFAINNNLIREIKNIAIYRGDNIFSDYVNFFYSARLKAKAEGDAVHDLLYKIFMNSLYGKFGQRNEVYDPVDDAPPDQIDYVQIYHPEDRSWEFYKVFGGKVWKKRDDEAAQEAFNSFPAIAAHVTAYARLLLWEAIETAGRENVYYCDTDSLFVNDVGYQHLWLNGFLDNKELGKLKLEDYGKLILFGVKDYIFESETENKKKEKIKGISKSAKKLPDSPDGKIRFAVVVWGGFSDRLKDKDFERYYNKVIIKQLRREYNKGIVEGNKIIPYRLDFTAEEIAAAKEAEKKYRESILEKTQDLFVEDYIRALCETVGFIRVVKPGEYYYHQYKRLPEKIKMKYFRRTKGLAVDDWCAAVGKNPNDLFEELEYYRV